MLFKIPLIESYIFSVLYPLCLWINFRDPLKNKFHHFHLGLPCVIGALVAMGVCMNSFSPLTRGWTLAWIVLLLINTALLWNRETASPILATIPSMVGLMGFGFLQNDFFLMGSNVTISNLLSGMVLTLALYAMNLGHFYLNVHGLAIKHLRNATYVFWAVTAIRLLWNIFQLMVGKIFYDYMMISVHQFLFTVDGFLLSLGILFGTIFPLVTLYFVKGTLDAKSTQSATGILYVIVSAVLFGEIVYKYYLLKFGVSL